MSSDVVIKQEAAIQEIFSLHGKDAFYITNTGFNSRLVHSMFPDNDNIFYMQGSMGLSMGIALGIAKNSSRDVVAIVGDGSFLMHLGLTHTVYQEDLRNLFVYVIDNGCHESVGSYPCAPLKGEYLGVNKIFKTSSSTKLPRVKVSFQENASKSTRFLSEKNTS